MAITKTSPAAAAVAKPARVSMNPSVFTAGGLIDDIDVEITDAATTMFDYDGNSVPTPALAVELTDPNGTQHTQYYSAGKPEDWQPEDSGEGFIALSGKTAINNSTNLGKFLESLVKSGFPADRLDDGNLKAIIGTHAHVIQELQEERKGLIRTGKNKDRPKTLLLVSKVISLPGESTPAPASKAAVGGKANGVAKTATPAAPPVPGVDCPISDETIAQIVLAWLLEHPGESLARKDLVQLVNRELLAQGHTQKDTMKGIIRAGRPDFLKSLSDHGIQTDGAQLEMAQ